MPKLQLQLQLQPKLTVSRKRKINLITTLIFAALMGLILTEVMFPIVGAAILIVVAGIVLFLMIRDVVKDCIKD
jgi:ABC-type bacteriocin/lantibiotic exporter with double-glycine peptidase domain